MTDDNLDNLQEDGSMFNENFSVPELEAYLKSHLLNENSNSSNLLNQYSQNMNYGSLYMNKKSLQNSKKQQYIKRRYNIFKNIKKSTKPIIRKKVVLTEKGIEFKEKYYLVFTNLKKFPEKFVIGIHNYFFIPDLGLNKIERYQYRSINNYFQHYSDDSDMILSYLMTHKKVIQSVFPDLINNGWKKNKHK